MSADWNKVKQVAADALEQPREGRQVFALRECREDSELLREVLELIESFDRATNLLGEEGPPAEDLREALDHEAAAPGHRIARYLIQRPLGAGGMGSVFEALDESLGRLVALKLIHAPAANPDVRKRFENETRVLAMLRHPHIAQIYDAGIGTSGVLPLAYLAMEVVPGARTIDRYVREVGPEREALVAMIADVADAAHHGHQRGVIHRDLKPQNLLVDADGRAKVIDFGVARLIHKDADGTTTLVGTPGTPGYMSPEQFDGEHAVLDVRSDVYSLGIVARELLSGRAAFSVPGGRTPASGRSARSSPPRDLPKELGPELKAILDQATANDPESRYRSASEFAADLRRYLANEPLLAKPPTRTERARLFVRRNRLWVAVAAVAGVGIGVGIVGLAAGLVRAKNAEVRAVRQAARATRSAEFLKGLLHAAAPADPAASGGEAGLERSLGQTRSVSDLLGFAAARVESSFADDPELRAETAILLANAAGAWSDYRYVEITGIAQRCAAEAYGESDPRAIDMLERYALAVGLRDPAGGLPLSRRAYERAGDVFGIDKLRTVHDATIYAEHLFRSGASAEAAGFLEGLRSRIAGMPGQHDEALLAIDMARTTDGLADSEALGVRRDLLDRARRVAGPMSDAYAGALTGLIAELKRIGEYPTELVRLAREAVKLWAARAESGPETDALANLTIACLSAGDLAGAEESAREEVRICTAFMTPDSIYTPKAKGRLARVLLERGGKNDEAEDIASEASVKSDAFWGIEDGWSIYHLALWAEAVRVKGDARSAREFILRRRAGCRASFLKDGMWDLLFQATVLANCHMDLGDLAAARSEIDIAKQARERNNNPGLPSNRLVDAAERRLEALQAASGGAHAVH